MTKTSEEVPETIDLGKFLDEFPWHLFPLKDPEIVRTGKPSFAAMDPTKRGSWRPVLSKGIPVAVVWTDWEDGFGVTVLTKNIVTDRIWNYQYTAKACNIPASGAYITLDKYIEDFDQADAVTLGESKSGPLSEMR